MPSPVISTDFDNQYLTDSVCESFKQKLLNNDRLKLLLGYLFTEDGLPNTLFVTDLMIAFGQPIGSTVWLPQEVNITPDDGAQWLKCDGSTLLKADYDRLYAVLGASYDHSGTEFHLPDLRGMFLFGADTNHAIGTTGGETEVILTTDQIPAHTHTLTAYTTDSGGWGWDEGASTGGDTKTTSSTGGGLGHNNMPPYTAGSYYILAGYKVGGVLINAA